MSSSSINTTQMDGDLSLGRNIAMGGKAEIAGSVSIGHGLKVNGWLDAPNIKAANKGMFLTLQALQDAYPEPQDGWFAGVGDSTPFDAYTAVNGEWVASGGTLDINVDITQYSEDIEQAQQDIISMTEDLSGKADKQEVEDTYGKYKDISDFLEIKTDADDKILEGIAKDGTKVFSGNVDAPNIRQIDADVTQAKSDVQTLTGDIGELSETVGAVSEDLSQLQDDVVEKYGDYDDISEYVNIVTDSDGHLLEATKTDGTKIFYGEVKSPNIEDTEQKVKQMEEPVSFLDTMLSEEWVGVSVDDNQHILYGVKRDGTVYIYKLESPILEEKIKTIVTNLIGNIGKDINLQPSSFIPSEVQNRKGDGTIPTFDEITIPSSSVIEVNSQSDFDTALATLASTSNTSAILNLHTDVKRTQAANIAQGNTLIINGNGHQILGWNAEYTATSIKGDKAYCTYTGNLYGSNVFVSPTGEVLRLARTKCYKAASRIIAADTIEDADGNEIFHVGDNFPRTHRAFSEYTADGVTYHMDYSCVYHCKFQLPASLADIEIASTDGVFINLTTDWVSVQMPVIKVEDGWLYFDYVRVEKDYDPNTALVENNLGIDNDWWLWHSNGLGDTNFTSFYLINYQIEDDHSCLIKTINEVSTLIFPAKYDKVGESYTEIFKISSRNINFKISDAALVGYRGLSTYATALAVPSGNRIILDSCVIKGCVRSAVVINSSETEGYITRCEAYDCDQTVFSCVANSNNKFVAMHNYIHDTGNRRLNTYGIEAYGLTNYIAYNRIADFGYGAIRTGIWSEKNPVKVEGEWSEEDTGTYCESSSIIEYNIIYQTPEYFLNKAQHFVVMDAGAIYNGVHNKEAIIRHNIIYNYTGRGFNRGMYLDGGSYNIYVYSNIVANTPMSWSINAYYAEDAPYYGLPYTLDNVSKYICNNYVENGINIGGRTNYPVDNGQYYSDETHETGWNGQTLAENHCFLGHNIINKTMLTTKGVVNGIADDHKEEQYEISIPAYQGTFSTSLDIIGWLNKL